MHTHTGLSLSLALTILSTACNETASMHLSDHTTGAEDRLPYPVARRADTADDYHGTRIADPYRWLEDPDAPETRAWIGAENELTRAWLDEVPAHGAIHTRLERLWNFERYGIPQQKAGQYFFTKNDGLQNQAALYVASSPTAAGRLLLDPNTLSKDGTIALTLTEPSDDGRLLGYALAEAGSDWTSLHVRDVASGKDLPDRIEWVKFSGLSWLNDGSGFFYSTYPEHDTSGKSALKHHTLYFHRLGTKQADDTIVYARPDQPEWGFGATVTDDGALLMIAVWQGTEQKNRIYVQELSDPQRRIVKLLDDFDAEYNFLGQRGDTLYFMTDQGAARGRVIAIDRALPQRAHWREIIPESPHTLQSVAFIGERLIANYLEDAHSSVRVFDLEGGLIDTLALPGLGTASAFEGEPHDSEAFFSFTSFTTPTSIYRYDLATKKLALQRSPRVDFDPTQYVSRQVFYKSKDGTRVPMFITHRVDVEPGPDTPCLLYGYGGFNIPLTPTFAVSSLVWMERGGTYAVACLRGGGEYGRDWHEAGTKERKQNVFDDFIAAAEYLIAQRQTSTPKLAIHGRSNGGLLVGAAITQRPELFGAALPGVGVLDMLRYHRFTIGWAWASDYGSADDAQAFAYLRRYSPLHNIKAGTHYPPTLILTGDHDDRVVPAHSFKFAAQLQQAQGGAAPVLIRIETRAGHGAGKPTAMQIDEVSDELTFLTRALALEHDSTSVQAAGTGVHPPAGARGAR